MGFFTVFGERPKKLPQRGSTSMVAGAALAFGVALFGTVALVHFSTQYFLDLQIADSMHVKIDDAFVKEMQCRCGGPESTWKPLSNGRGYTCFDKHGHRNNPRPEKECKK